MKIVFIFTAMLAFAAPTWAARPLPDFSARVKVSVSSDDSISAEVKSYISRELRSLGDVVTTDQNPEYVLSVVASVVTTKSGSKRGVAFSVVVLEPFDNALIKNLAQPKYKKMTTILTKNLYRFSDQRLQVGSTNDLRSICSDIVAQFDTDELAPARKLWQSMKDMKK